MRTVLLSCFLLLACTEPPRQPLKSSAELVTALMQRIQKPRASPYTLRDEVDILFTRSDAVDATISRYHALPTHDDERWHLIRLVTTAAVRGSQKAVNFLLAEALMPDPPPTGGHGMASDGEPPEVLTKIEAAIGLVKALVSDPAGAASATQQLLQQADPWLAKTTAAFMAHGQMMSATYSGIMEQRGLVARFRPMTPEEERHYTTIRTTAVNTDAPPPAR